MSIKEFLSSIKIEHVIQTIHSIRPELSELKIRKIYNEILHRNEDSTEKEIFQKMHEDIAIWMVALFLKVSTDLEIEKAEKLEHL